MSVLRFVDLCMIYANSIFTETDRERLRDRERAREREEGRERESERERERRERGGGGRTVRFCSVFIRTQTICTGTMLFVGTYPAQDDMSKCGNVSDMKF